MFEFKSFFQYSRLSFCWDCYRRNLPKLNTFCYIAVPEKDNFSIKRKYSSLENIGKINLGFTPHIYFLEDLRLNKDCEQVIIHTIACGICGVKVKKLSQNVFSCSPKVISHREISIEYWNNLLEEAVIFNSK